jgi:uncharacterized protein YdhG (YjbR/CyaY superfamily)
MHSDAKTVAAYLRALPADRRRDLSALDRLIRKVAPEVKKSVQYGMPSYDLNGSGYALAAQKHYLALYLCEPDLVARHRKRIGKASFGKGCIRFRSLADLDLAAVEALLREVAERARGRLALH